MIFFHPGDHRNRHQADIDGIVQQHRRYFGWIVDRQRNFIYNGRMFNAIKQWFCIEVTDRSHTYFSVQVLYVKFGCKSKKAGIINKLFFN